MNLVQLYRYRYRYGCTGTGPYECYEVYKYGGPVPTHSRCCYSTNGMHYTMLPPSMLMLSLLACVTADTSNLPPLPAHDLPPDHVAVALMLAKFGAMEKELTSMKTIISTQTSMLQRHTELMDSMETDLRTQLGAHAHESARQSADIYMQAKKLESHSSQIAALEQLLMSQKDAANATQSAAEARLSLLEERCANATAASRHRLEEDDSHGFVTQHFAAVTVASGSAGTGAVSSGGAGPGGNGHRRTQGSSSCANFNIRANAVQTECCDEPTEDCSSGAPSSCNANCAAVFLPFWADCGAQLTTNPALYQSVVAQCQAAGSGGAGSHNLVHQFDLVCTNSSVTNCVPACSPALHGDLLLMNLNGEDSKYSCELHHGLHSWVGSATDGGYLGSDARAFVSAVLSGAAGFYALTLTGAAGVGTDLTIRPGQDVRISSGPSVAAALAWGSGGFVLQRHSSLTLTQIVFGGNLQIGAGARLVVAGGQFATKILYTAVIPQGVGLSYWNAGMVSFIGASMMLATGSTCMLNGTLPGMVRATSTANGQTVGTLTMPSYCSTCAGRPWNRAMVDHVQSSPPGWFAERTWNSGVAHTTTGHTFTLFLLPAMTGFTDDNSGGRLYATACQIAGLQPVKSGDTRWGDPSYTYFGGSSSEQLPTILLPFNDDSACCLGSHKSGWTHNKGPGWTPYVVAGGTGHRVLYSYQYEHDYTANAANGRPNIAPSALTLIPPVCGLENPSVGRRLMLETEEE
eukprot:COSAG01_NODE_6700_length_3538_cov_2.277406_3_plen_745_part_00